MKEFQFTANKISKYFNRGVFIFKNVDLNIENNSAIALTGYNGSGKSTFLKIIAGVLRPSRGEINLSVEGKKIPNDSIYRHISLVAPYLNIYEEFSALEILEKMAKIRGIEITKKDSLALLDKLNILRAANQPINTYSSGMKQRIKFALALQNKPEILYLDEPGTNLDNEGLQTVKSIIKEHIDNGGATIIASNDTRETDFCNSELKINDYKK